MNRSFLAVFLFYLLFGLIRPISVLAVSGGLSPEKSIKNLVMDQWTAEDGLISNNLTSLLHGSDGFLWITSFNGALRFDGNQFELFDRENIELLNSNGIYKCIEDGEGKIWFATQGSGIIQYSDHTFHKVGADQDLSLSIRCLFIDDTGRGGTYDIGHLAANCDHGF